MVQVLATLLFRFFERKEHLAACSVPSVHSGVGEFFHHFSPQLSATETSTETGASGPSTFAIPSSMQRSNHPLPSSALLASISTTTSSWTRFTTFGFPRQSLRRSQSRATAYLNPSPALPCIGVFRRSWYWLLHLPKRCSISRSLKRPDRVRVPSSPALALLRSSTYHRFRAG